MAAPGDGSPAVPEADDDKGSDRDNREKAANPEEPKDAKDSKDPKDSKEPKSDERGDGDRDTRADGGGEVVDGDHERPGRFGP